MAGPVVKILANVLGVTLIVPTMPLVAVTRTAYLVV